MNLPADLDLVVREVISQIPRLLALQDRDPDSPMRGSMHPAFWRDKSSDVADMRRQEAALAFAWVWRHRFPGNHFQGDPVVRDACLRALGFWTRQQHRDGTFDEWYKNEHGYATTAFSSYAVALTVEALGEALPDELAGSVRACLERSADWLATHDDWFKTNHQAVGVAALGAVGRLLGTPRHLDAARRNARRIAERRHEEGWSREITGLDLGYTFLLAEYLAMHAVLTGASEFLPMIGEAYAFAADFLHPDLTTGPEYGICANPYFSRVATVALAPHLPVAAGVLEWMRRTPPAPPDTSATLKDDLRLARYAYQPLLAALLHSGELKRRDPLPEVAPEPEAPLALAESPRVVWRPAARLLAVRERRYAAWAAPASGDIVRMVFESGAGFGSPIVDRGFVVTGPGGPERNARYALDVPARYEDGLLELEAPLVRAGFVMPPYWARVGLRCATALPGGPRAARWLIDQWRRRKGTALNQSSAGISRGGGTLRLARSVRLEEAAVRITDRLFRRDGRPLAPETIHLVVDGRLDSGPLSPADEDRRIPLSAVAGAPREPGSELRLERVYHLGPDELPRLEVTILPGAAG